MLSYPYPNNYESISSYRDYRHPFTADVKVLGLKQGVTKVWILILQTRDMEVFSGVWDEIEHRLLGSKFGGMPFEVGHCYRVTVDRGGTLTEVKKFLGAKGA